MKIHLTLFLLSASLLSSCAPLGHPDPYVRHGRRQGMVGGAVVGGIVGHNVRGVSKWEGAAAGAVLGGVMGDARGRSNRAYYGRRPRYY